MSRSNYDKPFYVDVGTSIVAVRCASNHDVVLEYDHARMPYAIELAKKACDRMNREVETHNGSGDCAKLTKTAYARFDICQDIALVLKIGRDYQNKDSYRGAHYDTVKLLCDAIEYQQEQLKTKTGVGDCTKLREALTEILEYIESFHKYITPGRGKKLTALFAVADTIRDKARAALAAPPRNCDVGTAEEQTARFVAMCHANVDLAGRCRESCPYRRVPTEYKCDRAECYAKWAQMPYEEGGAK